MTRSKVLSIRLSDEEFALLQDEARRDDRPVGSLIRRKLFGVGGTIVSSHLGPNGETIIDDFRLSEVSIEKPPFIEAEWAALVKAHGKNSPEVMDYQLTHRG